MKVAVVGLGLFGRALAVSLARAGVEVIGIDNDPALVDDVKQELTLAVALDATEERELRAQGVHEVDALVACIGEHFEANQLVVILAKKMGIGRVLSRTSTATHARILRLIGADEVILPEVEAAQQVTQRLVQPSLQSYFQLIDGFSIAEISAPRELVGRSLAELKIKERFKVNIVAIKRFDEAADRMTINPVPLGTEVLRAGDILAIAGADEDIGRMASRCRA